jgi:hypothetical protein
MPVPGSDTMATTGITPPKGRPTPSRGRSAPSDTTTPGHRSRAGIDPRVSWGLVGLAIVAVIVVLVITGIGEGGPVPTGGHGG